MKIKKLLSVCCFLGFIALIGILYSFTTNSIANYSSSNQPQWENLKVLPDNISKDSLEHLMKGYTKALGVKCSYCHQPRENQPKKLDFSDDSKLQKKIARGMIKMTEEINEDYFKPHYPDPKPEKVSDINCVTCHRGNPNPKKYLSQIYSIYPQDKEQKQ